MGSIIGGAILGGILIVVAVLTPVLMETNSPSFSSLLPALVIGIAVLIYATVMYLVLLYEAWKVIQDGHARTSPGKAVGFMFIPFFQLYWVFQAHWGFAQDYNAYVERHYNVSEGGISVPAVSTSLFLACSILVMVSGLLPWILWIPGIPIGGIIITTNIINIISLAMFILFILVINALCNAINNLPAYPGITGREEKSQP